MFFSVGIMVPLILAVTSKIFGKGIEISKMLCIYGYSMTIYVPGTLVLIIPSKIIQLIGLGYSCFHCITMLQRNLHDQI